MKMDDSAKSGATLEVSVSFGKFENDALSWEKWSSFSPNKYLEEVGTLSTPGSVAQKKAYFEAHYRKIAAKKAEELEQEESIVPVKPSPDVSSNDDPIANSSQHSTEFALSNGERLDEEVAEEACMATLTNLASSDKNDDARSSNRDEHGACANGLEEEIEGSVFAMTHATSAIEEAKVVSNTNADDPELNVRKGEVLVGLETQKNSKHIFDEPPERKNGNKQANARKKEISKLNAQNIASKVTPIKKERNLAGTKKKVVSPATKPLQASSTPKYAKSTSRSSSTPVSASQSSKNKVNGSVLPKSKNSQVGESKRVAPTSLHMSLSLGPTDSLCALSMTRKSLIMERMGDKDIVKRAFKTFQNRTNVSITDEKPSTVKNVSSTAFEPKLSSYRTPTKGNEGLRKDAEKRATQRSQTGTRSNPLPSGSHRSFSLDKKSTVSPATSLRSDEKAEKRTEFSKKLGAKSISREAENARLGAKSKVGVANGTRQRPTLNR